LSILLKNSNFIGLNNLEIAELEDLFIDNSGYIRKEKPVVYEKTLDLKDYYISPGWIDLHTHIFHLISNIGLNPDDIGPKTGVSVLVDAGSAGEVNFNGFKEYIIKSRNYPVYSFINIGSTGLMLANNLSELDSLKKIMIENLIECIENNRDYIKGVKLRASGVILRGLGFEIVKLAKKVAKEVDLPLMVHVGEPLPLLEDILPCLEAEDIVTHVYHGKRWGIFEGNNLIPEVKEALARGVKFDLGHGEASFDFNVAEKAISKGFKPYTISSDLHRNNLNGPVYDLATTISKMLNLGFSLEELIEMVSHNPAEILKIESYREDFFDKEARFTVFKIEEGCYSFKDSNNNQQTMGKFIKPVYTIIGSDIIKAGTNYPLSNIIRGRGQKYGRKG